ncbi:MAG: pyridoxal phosphate-dependent decarboxylase family protein, partial [Candidatus Hodarchaeota archaeon]
MKMEEFRRYAHEVVDWMIDYLENIENYPVMSQVKPKEVINQLPINPPQKSEPFKQILADFEKIILPGITHWQHPSFFAYFPANSSPPSVLAEMLTATLGAQCMIWQTSPAATELEERVMQWLGKMLGLPSNFTGVIQDSASTATLCSLLTAREQKSDYSINARGMSDKGIFTTYCSVETHSSIEKGIKIAGLGKVNLRKIPVDDKFAMIPEELEAAIQKDLAEGYQPLCTVATLGTTGSTAIDPLKKIGKICAKYNIWLHVDAALAGTALLLPEYRWMIDGIEYVDTFVFNPHKQMFTNFDCSAYFVKDPGALIRTFEILPEYLKTKEGDRVNNFRDWSIPL